MPATAHASRTPAPALVNALAPTARPGVNGDGRTAIHLGDTTRLALMVTPRRRGAFGDQAAEVLASLALGVQAQPQPTALTVQTVFLRDAADQPECERLFAAHYGAAAPVTNYVYQPPCCGAALAVEAWAVGGADVKFERCGPQVLAVSYQGTRWIHMGGVAVPAVPGGAYPQAQTGFRQMQALLATAGSRLESVVRTWLYQGGITELEGDTQRYKELNRARTDAFHEVVFGQHLKAGGTPGALYPASTGIGTAGDGLLLSCLAFETARPDACLLPLENPQQTPAYEYRPEYSPRSPKFSRAMALALGDCLTTWISGTASILRSESLHLGDIERQTDQTLDNIERLIAAENFARHGLAGAGATLRDLAKIRVYVKQPEDYAPCRAVCERRLGNVPAIYAVADVCRPELLVEIEGVAFSRCAPPGHPTPGRQTAR